MAWVEKFIFTNAEFEDGDKEQPWVPDNWALNDSSTRWVYAAFDEYAAGGTERFESGFGRHEETGMAGWQHKTADRSDMAGYSIDTLGNCIITANAIKVIANLHFPDADYHVIGDSRTISSADATDLPSLAVLVNELVADCKAHADDTTPTWHRFVRDGWDQPFFEFGATELFGLQVQLYGLIVGFGRHLWWRGNRAQWSAFAVLTTSLLTGASVDPDDGSCLIGTFDSAEYDAEEIEDFEEGWESEYLDPGVQTQLGKNEDYLTDLIPTIGSFAQGDDFDGFEEAWAEPRHKAPDETDVSGQDISDQAKAIIVANYFKDVANAHFPSTAYHVIADPRTIGADYADNLATLLTLVNELYTDTREHALDAGLAWHLLVTDDFDVPDTADHPATDLDTAKTVLAAVVGNFGRHLRWKGNELAWDAFSEFDLSNLGGDLTAAWPAKFDTTKDEYEDFEEEWRGNEDTYDAFTIPTNLVLAPFVGAAGYDSFETSRAITNIGTGSGDVSDELPLDRSKPFYFETSGTYTAIYRLQCQRSIGGAWITIIEFDANTTLEVPDGYRAARIYTVTHTTGTLFAYVTWEQVDIF